MPQTPIETVRHLLLDQVLPLCLTLRGCEAIHASALATRRGACGFLGDSGSGKSTLAASLITAGCTLLADDCLALTESDGRIVTMPGYPGLRLWPTTVATLFGDGGSLPTVSHYNNKKRLAVTGTLQESPQFLTALFVLRPPEQSELTTCRVERLSAADGLRELLSHAFRLDVTDRKLLSRQFSFFGRLLSQTPVYRLSYPRDFVNLPTVRKVIFDTCDEVLKETANDAVSIGR